MGGSRMNRSKAGKWASRAVWLALAATLSIGCNPLNIAAFMFGRKDKLPKLSNSDIERIRQAYPPKP